MDGNVRHRISFGRGRATAAVIAGAAVAMMCTGTAFAANMTPTPVPAAAVSHDNPQCRHNCGKPRTGGSRDAVDLGPGRRPVAGQLVPARPSLAQATIS